MQESTYYLLVPTYRRSPFKSVIVRQTGREFVLFLENQCFARVSPEGHLTIYDVKSRSGMTARTMNTRREMLRQFCHISKAQIFDLHLGEETAFRFPVRKRNLLQFLVTDQVVDITYRRGKVIWRDRSGQIHVVWINYGQHPLEDSFPVEVQSDCHTLWDMKYQAKFLPVDQEQISAMEEKVIHELTDLRDRQVITDRDLNRLMRKYVNPFGGGSETGEGEMFEESC